MDQPVVLIVDDEPRVLDALEAILAAEFRVLRAEGGEAALARLAVLLRSVLQPSGAGGAVTRKEQTL